MKSLLAFALLLTITFIGSLRLFRQYKSRFSLAYLIHSGTFFLIFGFLVGQNGWMWISEEILNHLEPLLQFGLGWAGFMYGFQMEKRYIQWVPKSYYATTAFLFLLPAGTMAILLNHFSLIHIPFSTASTTLIVLISISPAILLSESATSFVFWANRRHHLHGRNIRLISFVAAVDNVFPILFSALLLCGIRIPGHIHTYFLIFAIQIIIGLAAGWGIHLMVKNIQDSLDVSTILFGIVFALAGTAYLFQFSTLFITMIAGITFTNLTRRHSWFQKRLAGIEKPLYLMFMVALPLYHSTFTLTILFAAVAVITVKWVSKAGVLLVAPFPEKKRLTFTALASFLFLPMGSIGPAVLLEMRQFFSSQWIMEISGIFIVSMILSEVIGPMGVARFSSESQK